MGLSRPLSTTEANGPYSAAGTGLALDSLHNSLGHHTNRFPTADAFLPDASKTGATVILPTVAPFPPPDGTILQRASARKGKVPGNSLVVSDGVTAWVSLGKSQWATIDTQSFDLIRDCNWFGAPRKGGCYAHSKMNGITRIMHRVIADPPPDKLVDHINGNKSDNRRGNLRLCTNTENQWNRVTLPTTNKTGVIGVCWLTKQKRWRAAIEVNGAQKTLGWYKCFDDAVVARRAAEFLFFGAFAPHVSPTPMSLTSQSDIGRERFANGAKRFGYA